ncbi:hypothetical protein [Flavobacterium cerinum]|uniref:Lipoprotein n=1 Tax=Flavobacterium cerinum TaxID=2502784 RepID=A0ABY5IRH9_9FLAO|nr:hypothetical protein [Flavobacterium cerinum]UUC44782.1 hypothetical protein NOX80_14235 [Flavobacterium cerinum]
MKYGLYCLVVLFLLIACQQRSSNINRQIKKDSGFSLFVADSGFVTKKEGLLFLLTKKLTDTVDSYWNHAKENDTIGKYYKIKETGHYYFCTIDLSSKYNFETHLLIEIKENGTIVDTERFYHGAYPCCWGNYYDGFQKYGHFFGIKTCATGSGYCAGYLHLFQNKLAQGEFLEIPVDLWSSLGFNGLSQKLDSWIVAKKDTLLVHYTLEEGKLNEDSDFQVQHTQKITVTYRFENNKWITHDDTTWLDDRTF